MIERISGPTQSAETGKILKMVHNPRMGGSVPAWIKADSARDTITANFAALGKKNAAKTALSYRMENAASRQAEPFGFYDLLDMVNPLQHIPLVNVAYRKITGDEIRGAPQIIGGAIFGGALGAAGGLANVIIQEETGKGFTDNALALASGKKISYRDKQHTISADNDLPVSMLAFTNTGTRNAFTNELKIADQSTSQHPVNFSPYEIY